MQFWSIFKFFELKQFSELDHMKQFPELDHMNPEGLIRIKIFLEIIIGRNCIKPSGLKQKLF